MVPTPFTWSYGGHEVFVSGSFNGWSERLMMGLVEGSTTVFQRFIDLPPGCYQYKFLVDGSWQVDQHQICAPDEYGTISNIVVVPETEPLAPNFSAEALQPSSSTVNPRAMQSVGSSSSGQLNESVLQLPDGGMEFLQLPDGGMEFFRRALLEYMLSSTIYDLVPNSGKVFALDVELDVEQAYHVIHEKGLAVVPLWDEGRGQMTGMLTASDFILILLQLHTNRAMIGNEALELRTISSWKDWKLQHHRDAIGTSVPLQRRPLIHGDPDESLAVVVSKILQHNICAIPILHSADGSSPRLLHVACLAGVLKHICRHFKDHLGYLPLFQQPIGYLPFGTWATQVRSASSRPLLMMKLNDPFISALTLLLEGQISSVPIVDDGGNLITVYCRSDVTSLARENIYTRLQLNQMTISQALEIRGEAGQERYKTCTRFDTLYKIMELLSEPDARRVIVVDASSRRQVEGIITLRDVFKLFLG